MDFIRTMCLCGRSYKKGPRT